MRAVLIVLAFMLLALQYRLWISDEGLREVWSLRGAVAAQQQENVRLEERNARLAAEVEDLREGLEAVEEIARNDLGMIGPGERFYQVAEPQAPVPEED